MWWHPEQFNQKKPFLEARMAVIKALRAYFDGEGFWEVETPILQVSPVMDTHIHAFKTELKGVDLQVEWTPYLHTSPEFAMKKLMVGGIQTLYQICHVFRNGEGSARHSPEFTMIEWYRAPGDYNDIMKDCVGLLHYCAKAAGVTEMRHKDSVCDPFAEWEKLTLCEAFDRYAGIDLAKFLDDKEGLRQAVMDLGLHTAEDDGWDDLFFRVVGQKIEPFLGMERPTILCDYPAAMASLSRKKPDDPRFAERFELYVCGIELANAFSELTDAKEQRARFIAEMDYKQKLYGERYPIDEEFLEALEYGLPDSGGIALGVDRLVMLLTGASDIKQVLWTPV